MNQRVRAQELSLFYEVQKGIWLQTNSDVDHR